MPSTIPSSRPAPGPASAFPPFPGTVVIELDRPEMRKQALACAADWSGQGVPCLIADAVGLDEGDADPIGVMRYPTESLPRRVSRYRMALAATGDWILFLAPGQSLPPGFIPAIPEGTAFASHDYRLTRQIHLAGVPIATLRPRSPEDPLLVPRAAYVAAEASGRALHAAVFPEAVLEPFPVNNLPDWIATEGRLLAETGGPEGGVWPVSGAVGAWLACGAGRLLSGRWLTPEGRRGWFLESARFYAAIGHCLARQAPP